MKSIYVFIIFITFCWTQALAQYDPDSLYIPRGIKQAYKNGTRSRDGRPGKNYWQNHGRYDIHISVDPRQRNLIGMEEITYFNNSPDTLRLLVFKLIQNMHKTCALNAWLVDSAYFTSGVHIDSYSEDDIQKSWKKSPQYDHYWYYNTIHVENLLKPLWPGDSLKISFQWHEDISRKGFREGMIDSTTCFLGYFYPRIAVYDDYQGWDMNEIYDDRDFYNDFNDYILSVEVPGNYLVWATGTLINGKDVLQPIYMERLYQSMKDDKVEHIISRKDLDSGNITKPNKINTWKWTVNNISDISLVIGDHYIWDAASVLVDNINIRRTSVQAIYFDYSTSFKSEVNIGCNALNFFSRFFPGIPYPYEKSILVNYPSYGLSMEYPMMVVECNFEDSISALSTTVHEMAHSYMPFYIGTNEIQYAFMDEGWATTFQYLTIQAQLGNIIYENIGKTMSSYWSKLTGLEDKSTIEDLPMITPSTNLRGYNYYINSYIKPALAYLAIKDLLGENSFKLSLHEFMDRWHGKHPMPWDFFYTFNDASGQNLNWFWNNWFFSNNYMDIGIKNVTNTKNGYAISLDNNGGMAIPFDVNVIYSDSSKDIIHQTPAVWKADFRSALININSKKKIISIALDGGIYMDADESDNKWANVK